MGEIAEMMLSGILCCQCGETLDEEIIDMENDVPIVCSSCFDELSEKGKVDFEHRNERFLLNKLERNYND